jgi:hypothetical protein
MSDIPPPSVEPESLTSALLAPQRRLILTGAAGGVIFLALVCVALVIVLATRGHAPGGGGSSSPTPAQGTSVPPSIVTGLGGSVPLSLTTPSAIELKNKKFDVIPVEVTKGAWPYQRGNPNKAVWVFGTLVNYVFGLEANSDNTDLLQGLTESDSIKLITLGGKTLSFRYSGRQWVTVDKTDVFRQLRPGLTLVLLGEQGDSRLVVSASYVAESEPTPIGITAAKTGTPVEVSGARVTTLGGRLVKNVEGLPAGNAYYLVDFSVTASGSDVLDASLFQMELLDAAGKRYTLSVPASQAGSYGPPGGQLLPDATLTATAGFVVPEVLPGPSVFWTFSPTPDGPAPARFQLSTVGPTPTPEPRTSVAVQVTQARYSDDATEIIISGGIGNRAKEPVTVSLSDINLQAGGTLVPVTSTEPELPWTLQPGQNLAFTLHFARPPAGTAIFKMMQSSFELGGLQ